MYLDDLWEEYLYYKDIARTYYLYGYYSYAMAYGLKASMAKEKYENELYWSMIYDY